MKTFFATALSIALASADYSGYCTDYEGQTLSGAVEETTKCSQNRKCGMKEAADRCDKEPTCMGFTCADKDSKCVIKAGTVLASGDKKDVSFLKADNRDCKKAKINKKKRDEFDYTQYNLINQMGGVGLDPMMTTVMAGASLSDAMVMNMATGGALERGQMSTELALGLGADLSEVIMYDMILGADNKPECPEGTTEIETRTGTRCVADEIECPEGQVVVNTPTGKRCGSRITTTVGTPTTVVSGRCPYGTRLVSNGYGGLRSVCNPVPSSLYQTSSLSSSAATVEAAVEVEGAVEAEAEVETKTTAGKRGTGKRFGKGKKGKRAARRRRIKKQREAAAAAAAAGTR